MKLRWLALVGATLSALAFGQDLSVTDNLLLSHTSGVYRGDLWLRAGTRDARTSVEFRFAGNDYFLPLRRPLHLTAIPGEERTYTVDFRAVRDGRVLDASQQNFTIDKRPPPPPAVDAVSGTYVGSLRLRLSSSHSVEYTLNRPLAFEPQRYTGGEILLEAETAATDYVFRARAIDGAGNRSAEVVREYAVLPPQSVQTGLSVVSPVAGEFANPQLLFVRAPADWTVYYGFADADITEDGTLYDGPVILPGSGNRRLAVAARDEEGEWHTREVRFSQQAENPTSIESAAYTKAFVVSPPGFRARYVTSDRVPSKDSPVFDAPLDYKPQAGLMRVETLRFVDESGAMYRYVFLIEGRDPGVPEVRLEQSGAKAILRAAARPGAHILYSVDASESDAAATRFQGQAEIDLPVDTEDGLLTVSVFTRLDSGVRGRPVGETLEFDTRPPPAPELSLEPVATGLRIGFDRGARIRFELGDREPDGESPFLAHGSVVEVPFGMAIDTVLRARSVDDAGNLSQEAVERRVTIDRLPPPTPTLSIDDSTVQVEGSGTLLVQTEPEVPSLSDSPESAVEGFRLYTEALRLPGEENRRIEYTVVAMAIDDAGNASPTVEEVVVVNRRTPVVPPLAGLVDGGVYNLPRLTVAFRDPDPDLELYYTVTADGSEPADPTLDDERYTGPFPLTGEPGTEVDFRMKVLPHYPHIPRSGAVRSYRLLLDQKPPDLPEVAGIHDGLVTSSPPLVDIRGADTEDTVYYAVGSPDRVDALGPAAVIYSSPFEVDVPVGEERTLGLDIAVRDAAGNVNRIDEPIRFVVDRLAPARPEYEVTAETGSAVDLSFGSQARLSFLSETQVYYEVTSDGRVPPTPGPSSPVFDEEIVLGGVEGSVVQYNVAAVAIDDAGNRSAALQIFGLAIDREPPAEPREPTIRPIRDGTAVEVAWDVDPDATLYFRLSGAPGETDGDEAEKYEGPFEVVLPVGERPIVLSYFYRDTAGNRSSSRQTEITMQAKPAPPAIVGVEPSALYSSPVSITAEEGTVRYEIALAPDAPSPVTRFSPAFDGALRVDGAEDETVRYRLRARRFNGDRASDPVALEFTIDRSPPPPPELLGVSPGGYYEDEQVVSLSADEGTIFVAVRRSGVGGEPEFRPYDGPIRLAAEEGDLASYTVFAYTRDEAGNRSAEIATWEIFIDREVIYVSPDGDDQSAGSRAEPFATLDRALEFARSSERSTVFLAAGAYTVGAPIEVDDALSLVGGHDPETWQRRSDARSVLQRGRSVSATKSMFTVGEGAALNVASLEIAEPKGFWETIVEVDGGTVGISDSTFVLAGRSKVLRATGGSVAVTGSSILLSRTAAGSVFEVSNCSVELRSVDVELEDVVSSFDVIRGTDCIISLADSRLAVRDGWAVRMIAVEGGTLRATGLEIDVASARENVTGVAATSCEVTLAGAEVRVAEASYALGMRVDGGTASLDRVAVHIAAVSGGTGLIARGTTVDAGRSSVAIRDADEFAYGVSAGRSSVDLSATVLEAGAGGEAFLAVVEDTELAIRHVTGAVSGAPRISGGVNATGGGSLEIGNSILLGPDSGVAVSAGVGVRDDGIRASSLYGWSIVFRRGERVEQTVASLNRYYRNLLVLGRITAFEENYSFPAESIFAPEGLPRLSADSPLVDAGAELPGGPTVDIDGESVPRNRPDVGADEYYPTSR